MNVGVLLNQAELCYLIDYFNNCTLLTEMSFDVLGPFRNLRFGLGLQPMGSVQPVGSN